MKNSELVSDSEPIPKLSNVASSLLKRHLCATETATAAHVDDVSPETPPVWQLKGLHENEGTVDNNKPPLHAAIVPLNKDELGLNGIWTLLTWRAAACLSSWTPSSCSPLRYRRNFIHITTKSCSTWRYTWIMMV